MNGKAACNYLAESLEEPIGNRKRFFLSYPAKRERPGALPAGFLSAICAPGHEKQEVK